MGNIEEIKRRKEGELKEDGNKKKT